MESSQHELLMSAQSQILPTKHEGLDQYIHACVYVCVQFMHCATLAESIDFKAFLSWLYYHTRTNHGKV